MSALRDPYTLLQLLVVAVTVGVVLAVFLQRTVGDPRFAMTALLISRGVVPALIGAFGVLQLGQEQAVVWGGRISVLVLVVATAVGALTLSRRDPVAVRAGRGLLLGSLAFVGMSTLSEFAMGEVGDRWYIGVLYFLAAWLSFAPPEWLAVQLKRVLGLYVIGSAIAVLFFAPAISEYEGSLIGIDLRARGLLPHANGLGPIMLLYLILESLQPSSRWLRWSVGGTAVVLLVLSQSKATWGAAAVVAVLLWAGRSQRGASARFISMGLIAVILAGTIAMTDSALEYEVVDQQQVDSLRTLTGRTAVWAYGLEQWRAAPVFGAGGNLFLDYAQRTGHEWAGQAHNQYVQTLGRHGLVGLMGLLLYLGVLVRMALRHRQATRYVSVALVGLVLVRSLAEANLDALGIEQLTVISLLLAWERNAAVMRPLAVSGRASEVRASSVDDG